MGASDDNEGTLRAAWQENAADWVRWGASPGLDHAFWRMNLPWLLDLIPPPGRLTVDVGCGEGRVARVLRERGHRVIGIESSPALAAAAREADPGFEVHVADAARMPLADRAADIVVASMVFQSLDHPAAVMREIARVLAPGGRLCASFVHPLNSLGGLRTDASYFEVKRYADTMERDGATMTFHDVHRPFGDYARLFEESGLLIEAMREPVPDDDYVASHPQVEDWRRRPLFLQVRALRPF